MKSNMSVESWMDRQLNDYLDQQDSPCGSFNFRYKIRGGWANVEASISEEDDSDEDGYRTCLVATIDYCHWCFNNESEVDLDEWEEREIREMALKIGTDI